MGSSHLAAQSFDCGGIQDLGDERDLDCSPSLDAWENEYKFQGSYVPGSDLNANVTKTIKVAIHVWQDASGNGNFPENTATIEGLNAAIQSLNINMWTNNDPPSDILAGVPYIQDVQLRASLEGIYFYQNATAFTNCSSISSLNTAALAAHPEVEKCVQLHIVRPTCYSNDNSYANQVAISSFTANAGILTKARLPDPPDVGLLAGIWAHEMGHILGLWHTYEFLDQEDHCERSNIDFLEDVFGDGPEDQPLCVTPEPGCDVCYHDISWNCNVSDPNNSCTNNMMGGTSSSGYFSPLQMGRMHRTLALRGARKYAWGFSNAPYTVQQDETWDFNIKFYQDIIVPAGITLTVKCIVEMVPQAKVIVQQGGRLIIDGGKFTAAQYSDAFWGGIEVWGNAVQHQFPTNQPTYQGLVILKNRAVIEHAREAIRLWKPGDWNSMGGVVKIEGNHDQVGATFLNCRRSIEFMAYQNFHPSNPSLLRTNQSSIAYAEFFVDPDYRGIDDFEGHVSLWGVDGVQFRACKFKSTQMAISSSPELGEGIISIDANYTVSGNCTVLLPYGVPCPVDNLDRGSFTGLGHGIDAKDGGSGRGFLASNLTFENNVIGIYTSGLSNFTIIKNHFVLGNREVSLDGPVDGTFFEPNHRAISTQGSYGFRIEENSIEPAATVTANGVDGITIANSHSNNTRVYKNYASHMNNAYVGEANCIDPVQASFIGHQFLCNTNDANSINVTARPDASDPWDHSIRTQQGSNSSPAGNTFDQEVAVLDESDIKNNTTWVMNYWHGPGVIRPQPLDVSTGWVGVAPADGGNSCPSHLNGVQVRRNTSGITQLTTNFSAAKTAYINTAYVFNSLLDGGNTDVVVEEVQTTWPNDAWELRNYLMSKSPYLSTKVLKEMIDKHVMPQAMELEICLANPEATKKEGFIKWVEYEAAYPFPTYMIDLIAGSWEAKTFRMQLEAEMGAQHADMTFAADEIQAHFQADTTGVPVDSMLYRWQQLPNYGARYSEVQLMLRKGNYDGARGVLNNVEAIYPMKGDRMQERDGALWFVERMEGLKNSGRTVMEMSVTEVAEFEAFAEGRHDNPGTWAKNILCFGYQICLPDPAGHEAIPKALHPTKLKSTPVEQATLQILPNPATVVATLKYDLKVPLDHAFARIVDAAGREVVRLPITNSPGQTLWDTRGVESGVYSIELFNANARLATERLLVQTP